MSTDYHSIKADKLIRGQILLDRGSERKIVGIHKLPGRIYVYIQKGTTKAQLQFSPLEVVSVRNDSSNKQIFPDTFSNTSQPRTQVENDGITEPHFDSDHLTTLPLHQPELLEDAAIRLNNDHVMRELLRQQEESEARQLKEKGYVTRLFLEVNGDGTVTPIHYRDATPFSSSPSASQPYRELQNNADEGNYAEKLRREPAYREHNKTAIQVMRVGAIAMLIGVLLAAFGIADRSDGTIMSWGVILAVIGGMIYTVGILVAFFKPHHHRGAQVGEAVEQFDAVRDFDWGILALGLHGVSVLTPTSPPPAQNVIPPPTTSTSSDQNYQAEVQAMARQQEQKAISGAAPPVDTLSSSKDEHFSSHFAHQETAGVTSSTRETTRIHGNDASKKIDEALEQIDEMGAIEAMKKSPHTEDESEE